VKFTRVELLSFSGQLADFDRPQAGGVAWQRLLSRILCLELRMPAVTGCKGLAEPTQQMQKFQFRMALI